MISSGLFNAQGLTIDGQQRIALEWLKAGYHDGGVYTVPPVVASPTTLSDTLAAIANAPPGTVQLPKGTLTLQSPIVISQPGRCLRGHPDGTELYLSRSLTDALGQDSGEDTWSWRGGFIWSTATELGLLDFDLRAKDVAYAGHNKEAGYNGIYLDGAQQVYIDGVNMAGLDSGILASGQHITIRNCDINSGTGVRRYASPCAHYGMSFAGGQYNLAELCKIRQFDMHSLSVGNKSAWNVFRDITGWQLELDHHKDDDPCHHTLYSRLTCDRGNKLWSYGGPTKPGWFPGGFGDVYWNVGVKGTDGTRLPVMSYPSAFDPFFSLVGYGGTGSVTMGGRWLEAVPLAELTPPELLDALRALGTSPPPPALSIEERLRAKLTNPTWQPLTDEEAAWLLA